LNRFLTTLKPISIVGLLATVVLLFGFQADTVLAQSTAIALTAVPLLIQAYGIFAIAYAAAKALRLPHNIAAPARMIGTSNLFKLAVGENVMGRTIAADPKLSVSQLPALAHQNQCACAVARCWARRSRP
jgi:ACR3 family arsenite efflux pump ArsB